MTENYATVRELVTLRREFTALRREFTALRREFTALKGQVTKLRNRITALEDGREVLEKVVKEMLESEVRHSTQTAELSDHQRALWVLVHKCAKVLGVR